MVDEPRSSPAAAWWPVVLATVIAAAVLLPGLGDHGLWGEAELPALDRARAALGASLSDLERSPWLPDLLRTRSYAMSEDAMGLRLPHALATMALVMMAALWAKARDASPGTILLAAAFALAFPMTMAAGRITLGNPIGEAMAGGAVLSGLAALRAQGRSRIVVFAGLSAGFTALSVTSTGLMIGGAIPVGVLAAAASSSDHCRRGRAVGVGLWALFLGTVALAVTLSLDQQDGYIPLLGDAKDLLLIDKPQNRRFAAGVEDLGYGLFPWAPLVIAGAVLGGSARLPALWLGVGVAVAGGWSLVYGMVPIPVTIPAALCATTAIQWTQRAETPRVTRRLVLTAVVLAMLVLGKDAQATPGRVSVPIFDFEGEHTFPDERLEAAERLGRVSSLALLALLFAGLVAPAGGRPHRLDRLLDRLPADLRPQLAILATGAAATWGAVSFGHGLHPDACNLLSPQQILGHHAALAEAGHVPWELGNHRVRDPGLAIYGPGDVVVLASRRELSNYLAVEEPRAALIRNRDLAPLHQDHRQKGWPLFVLDDRHAHLRLVSNQLPPGEEDLNPIPAVVFDEPVELAHPTSLQFEKYIEIIGWEMTDPVVRGKEATLRLTIRVLRPLPGGSKIYARLLKGRSSRLNSDPHELTDGIYPPNLWRNGDYILHEFTFTAPLLEIQPGAHELIIGLRRSERQNFDISIPVGKAGEYGVRVRGTKRNFATIGSVEVL